jgi:hypothetical protein
MLARHPIGLAYSSLVPLRFQEPNHNQVPILKQVDPKLNGKDLVIGIGWKIAHNST